MDLDYVDLFSGASGWEVGARTLGLRGVGIENDPDCILTRKAAELDTLEGDVRMFDAEDFAGVDLLLASPPCQTLSLVGKRAGLAEVEAVVKAVHTGSLLSTADLRTGLMTVPLDWVLRMRPRAVAFEQVPAALSIWEACVVILRQHGYSAWAGMVNSEQFGVPQSRKRAILLAALDREVDRPEPTHSKYHLRYPYRLDEGVPSWRSIQDVIKVKPWMHLGDVRTSRGTVRAVDLPAPTLLASIDNGNYRWTDFEQESRAIEPWEAAVLQTFPRDYPWQGSRSAHFRQIGNAIPPKLAAALIDYLR